MSEVQNTLLSTLVARVAEELQLTQKAVKDVADALFANVIQSVVAGETVRISGFGTLEAADTAAKTGRNPQDGSPLEIAASKRVSFKASKPFKDAVKATV